VKGIHKPVDVWELVNLAPDQRPTSPYLEIEDSHLLLKELDIDTTTLSADERDAIQKALARALVHLSANTPQTTDNPN
jgi:hypothetical protein